MKLTRKHLKSLADLPWRNDFCWLEGGDGSGILLHRTYDEELWRYWMYRIPSEGITAKMYQSLPEGAPFELHNGKLIFMAGAKFNHQRIEMNLSAALFNFVDEQELGEVMSSPFDVILGEQDVIQPDLLFVHREREEIIKEDGVHGAPDLVVEIHSKSTQDNDEKYKFKILGRKGTEELWFIHPTEKWVKQYVREAEKEEFLLKTTLTEANHELNSHAIPGLVLSHRRIFKGTK
jgi:Uma2 family endonuclease